MFGTGAWAASNPASIPPIQYYLKDRVNSGKVSVEIYDGKGQLIQTLPASNRKGINKVYWNQRIKPPKTATGGSKIDYGGFIAPMVLPGDYTIKLKIGDKEYSQPLTLIHDERNNDFTVDDRSIQHKTGMELYKMHEDLAKIVDDINDKQKILKEGIEKTKNKKSKKLFEDYNASLEKLRAECLATKQKSMFADEERLRERITDVYMSVTSQESRPSNLQIQRVALLQEQLSSVNKTNKDITAQFYNKTKDALVKEGLMKDDKASSTLVGDSKVK
jgi:hypothetical protein